MTQVQVQSEWNVSGAGKHHKGPTKGLERIQSLGEGRPAKNLDRDKNRRGLRVWNINRFENGLEIQRRTQGLNHKHSGGR